MAFVFGFLIVNVSKADELSLVRVGDEWRFLRGTNEPSSPVTAWRELTFNDSSWSEGRSGFSTIFLQDGLEATLWPQTPACRSFFLRRKFSVVDPQTVKWMLLRLDYDDGFVAYLNGHEIARRGLTNEPVAFDDWASYHPGGAAEEFDVSNFANLLNAGDNVLAIQIHTSPTNPPGLPNSLRVVPELMANFTRGPFLQNVSTDRVVIIWRTLIAADGIVEFGTNQNLGTQVCDTNILTEHIIAVTNLLPGTQYFYRVRSTSGSNTAASSLFSFHTFKEHGDFNFLVLADSGTGSANQYKLAALMNQTDPDLVLHCGDVIYDAFLFGREDFRCFSVYGPQMRSVPFYFTMGNHELEHGANGVPYLASFHLPTNSVSGTQHYYSFDHAGAHFVSLLIPTLGSFPALAGFEFTNGSPQYCWLTNDLATTTKPWKFVFFHSPLANSGNHRFDDENGNNIYDRLDLQEILLPVVSKYGVQLIFSGNDHDFERSNPINGVHQIVTGGGGGYLRAEFERDAACSQFYLLNHFTKVSVQGDTLFLEAVGTNGVAFDHMTLQRALPPAQLYQASWHSPVIETEAANDGHGNINGQTFDFTGTPIPTMGGDFSNLGRIFVNNDATHLFIGFDQAMIYSDNNIFLFLESPRLSGVTNLIGLGSSPAFTVEGVKGLDFLENLTFTNFNPCVAVLLGDEYADANDRMFSRPNLGLTNLGQGVFRLDTSFTDVPGTRLQQFNRSPQVLEPPFQLFYREQNANFIKVAIPFDQLGGLRPGDIIKIAAVVGGPDFDTNQQTRQLDTRFLGSSLSGSGQSNVVLGAVSVRLALDPLGDEDGDGLLNAWEMAHGLDPFSAEGDNGAMGDPDGDGFTNLQEQAAGTDPRDPASTLRLSLMPLASGTNRLAWSSVVGIRYQLEISQDLPLGFTNHPSPFFPYTASGTNAVFYDNLFPFDSGIPVLFYRLRVVP